MSEKCLYRHSSSEDQHYWLDAAPAFKADHVLTAKQQPTTTRGSLAVLLISLFIYKHAQLLLC